MQLLSVDGAMVPLVAGVWAEVKTLAVGAVVAGADGPRTTALSYFSRQTDAATFGLLATGETHRRGITTAGTVVAVADGAPGARASSTCTGPTRCASSTSPTRSNTSAPRRRRSSAPARRRAATGLASRPTPCATGKRTRWWRRWRTWRRCRNSGGRPRWWPDVLGYLTPPGADPLPGLRRGGLPAGQRLRRERQQAGGRTAAQGGGHALGAAQCRSAAGAAVPAGERRWDDAWPALWRRPRVPPPHPPGTPAAPPRLPPHDHVAASGSLPAPSRPKTIVNGGPTLGTIPGSAASPAAQYREAHRPIWVCGGIVGVG